MDEQEFKPISDTDILKTIKTRIIRYKDLKKVKSIDNLLVNNSCVIFIENNISEIGHWVCIVKRGNIISYFDSYGRIPDHEIYDDSNPIHYLSDLLYNCKYDLEYNEYCYQRQRTATCGRHVIVRIIMKDKTLEEYHELMKVMKNDDYFVTLITSIIKK